jgi:hypothetical protein
MPHRSADRSASRLLTAPDPEVRAVSRDPAFDRVALSPTRTSGPFRVFPSPSAVSRHHDPCLPAVFSSPDPASPRCLMAGRALLGTTSRLSSSDESVVLSDVAAEFHPMLSWASCPSKVFSDRPIVGGDLHFRHHQNASITVESPPGDRTAFSGQPGSC